MTHATSHRAAQPRLLDLFCGAGGAAMGYHRAGFDVVGVDINPQPRYPFQFEQAEALSWLRLSSLLDGVPFDAIHASPPCQAYSTVGNMARQHQGATYPDLVATTRELLKATGLPYVIENVVGAPLINPVRLCGSSFGLDVERHRLFECSFPIMAPPCFHGTQRGEFRTNWRPKDGHIPTSRVAQVYGNSGDTHRWGPAMGIDWMTPTELAQAIPPAYTEHIGAFLLEQLAVAA